MIKKIFIVFLFGINFTASSVGHARPLLTKQARVRCSSLDSNITVNAIIPGDNSASGIIVRKDRERVAYMNFSLHETFENFEADQYAEFKGAPVVDLKARLSSSINYGWHLLIEAQDSNKNQLLRMKMIEGTDAFDDKSKSGRTGDFKAHLQVLWAGAGAMSPAEEVSCRYEYLW